MSTPPPAAGSGRPISRSSDYGPFGRYSILAPIASGGMATVYVGRMQGAGGFERLVAIKTLHPHLSRENDFISMLLDEARVASRIRHPNVVSVVDVLGDERVGWSIVMDYVEGDHFGGLLRKASDAKTPLSVPVVLRVVFDALEGLAAAHAVTDENGRSLGVVHRDVSPQNILVGVDGVSRLADFGVATAESRLSHTRDGQLKGKVGYMAPEQVTEGRSTLRTDLFAMGIVLYEGLTGTRLFGGESTGETIRRLLLAPVPELPADRPDLAPLAPVLARALARDPAERYPSARAFANAIEAVSDRCGGIAHPRTIGELVERLAGPVLAERRSLIRAVASSARSHEVPTVVTRASIVRRIEPGNEAVVNEALVEESGERKWKLSRRAVAVALAVVVGGAAGAVAALRPKKEEAHVATASHALAVDRDARLVEGEPPFVPPDAGTSLAPTVVVRVSVGADGHVGNVAVYQPRSGLEPFERAAVEAVSHYRFDPAMRGGSPIASEIRWPVRFAPRPHVETVIRVKGSDTMGASLLPDLARAFSTAHPTVGVEIEALGSSTAFVGLFDGTADLGASSRPVATRELEEAHRLGIELEETVVGYDGIAVVVHPSNPLTALSIEDLASLYSGTVSDYGLVGGRAGPVRLVGRPTYSGTHSFFHEKLAGRDGPPFARTFEAIEKSDELVRAVAADPSAIGFVGAGHVDASVRVVAIAARRGGVGVAPDAPSIRNGAYPLCRALLVYSRGRPEGALGDFLRFVLSDPGHAIVESHGFVPSDAPGDVALPTDERAPHAAAAHANVLRIIFPRGETGTPTAARSLVRAAADFVTATPGRRIVVSGHADSEGDEAQNVRVSATRATSIVDALVRLGVPRTAISTEAMGSAAPIATNTSDEGRAKNRRVDLHLVEAPRPHGAR